MVENKLQFILVIDNMYLLKMPNKRRQTAYDLKLFFRLKLFHLFTGFRA